MTDDDTPEARRAAFAKALSTLMAARGVTQSELAAKINVSAQSSVSAWKLGQAEPERETVFAIERALGVRPGHLSRHLGYLPVTASKVKISTTEEAILADPALDDNAKQIVLSTYRAIIEANRPKPGRKRARR